MKRTCVILLLLLVGGTVCLGQNDIEDVMVEVYYVSDSADQTDTDGGYLAAGSKTYRIFVDLAPNVALTSLYADASHKFRVASTDTIFNNEDRGEALGFDIPGNRIDDNTVALDSWLTLGGATDDHRGVRKVTDVDGSVVGGVNNDGGSANVSGGLLVNTDTLAGISLTQADGLTLDSTAVPANFVWAGTDPSTVGALLDVNQDTVFSSTNMTWQAPNGVKGDSLDNVVLIAQITTLGDLMFNLNLEILRDDGTLQKYIWGGADNNGEIIFGLLNYPPACGRTDPAYLQYDPQAGCDDGSCQTLIIFGCLDTNACNYDANANFNVQGLCCWGPDSCNGLDASIVCPGVGIDEIVSEPFKVYPNPFQSEIEVQAVDLLNNCLGWSLYDIYGRLNNSGRSCMNNGSSASLVFRDLPSGAYLLILDAQDGRRSTFRLVKE